jgi:HSP20 family molecular chaperone IbpA
VTRRKRWFSAGEGIQKSRRNASNTATSSASTRNSGARFRCPRPQDGIEAAYKDGVLEIRAPKAEEAKPRQIEVTVR